MDKDARRHAPATRRNRDPILAVLERVLPSDGLILELGSGTGEHASYMAPRLAPRQWQPSDADPAALASIACYQRDSDCDALLPPIALDVTSDRWAVDRAMAVVAVNVIHIAPWSAARGIMAGAGRVLPEDGILYFYGPFQRGGKHTADSNSAFDEALKDEDPSWGVRDLVDVITEAAQYDLALREVVDMPANNLSVVFAKTI